MVDGSVSECESFLEVIDSEMTPRFHFRLRGAIHKAVFWNVFCVVAFISFANARPWTNKEGVVLEGELLGVDGKFALVQRKSDGRHFRIPVGTLSKGDQQFVAKVVKNSKPGSGLTEPRRGRGTES